ncbi:MAG: RHS repeat-associated protein [Vicingaceae bacterium]|jgi:RHS repeat-associated protein
MQSSLLDCIVLTVDPDNNPLTLDNETISYLYSTDDLRIYKKDEVYNYGTSAYKSHEDYYLMDAMGRTVAIFKKGFNGDGWEYYAHGSEREARILPTAVQVPGPNSTLTDTTQMQIPKDQATFYVNDHLGNTRITYTPTSIYGTPNMVIDDEFDSGSLVPLGLWLGNEVTLSNVGNELYVTTDVNAFSPIINKVLSNTDLINGQTYLLSLNADLGNTPNGVTFEIINAGVSVELIQGINSFPITINYSSSSVNPVIVFKITGYIPTSTSYNYTLDNIIIGQQLEPYTTNTVNYVADYFPYGKAVREFVNSGDRERYVSTQHERDAETGFDYRGARYYDSDVARFLSTDPWQNKYLEWSTYNYVMGNPIMMIDPTGKGADWVPVVKDGSIELKKEKGDNAETLKTFLNVSKEKADELYNSRCDNGNVQLDWEVRGVKTIENTIIHYTNNPSEYTASFDWNYNCYEMALALLERRSLKVHTWGTETSFKNKIHNKRTNVSKTPEKWKFCQTIIRFTDGNNTTHAATYLGTSKNGTVYTWTKNGPIVKPKIMTVKQLKKIYGEVDGFAYGKDGGFYN